MAVLALDLAVDPAFYLNFPELITTANIELFLETVVGEAVEPPQVVEAVEEQPLNQGGLTEFMRLLEGLESRILTHQVELLDQKNAKKSSNRTISSFIINEWAETTKYSERRAKDILSKINQMQGTLNQTSNFISSQLALLTEKQQFMDNKLVEIYHFMQSGSDRREKERRR